MDWAVCRRFRWICPFDGQTTGTVVKADLVPTDANLLDAYENFAQLVAACEEFENKVNHRVHREIAAVPGDRLLVERGRLHVLPNQPYALALGEERSVEDDQTIRFGSVRYSTPPGHVGTTVWCRVVGEELVIVARTRAGLHEIARHELSTPGTPRIVDAHYPGHPGGRAYGSVGVGQRQAVTPGRLGKVTGPAHPAQWAAFDPKVRVSAWLAAHVPAETALPEWAWPDCCGSGG